MKLTEKEEKVVRALRYPGRNTQDILSTDSLSDEELKSLHNKIDEVAEAEGELRRSLGDIDEGYQFTFDYIKKTLLEECARRG